MKSHNQFYEDISIAKGLSNEKIFRFSDIVKIESKNENVTEKVISDGTEMSESINDTDKEFSVKDPLNMLRTASNETTLVSKNPNITNEKNVIIATEKWKKPLSILSDEYCEKQAFPYLLSKGKFGYNFPEIYQLDLLGTLIKGCWTIISTLHQMQIICFSSRPVYKQHHLCCSMNFAKYKIKPGTLTGWIA